MIMTFLGASMLAALPEVSMSVAFLGNFIWL